MPIAEPLSQKMVENNVQSIHDILILDNFKKLTSVNVFDAILSQGVNSTLSYLSELGYNQLKNALLELVDLYKEN